MQPMTQEIRSHFIKLQQSRNLEQMICDLNRILDGSEPSDALRGFCYWNLSDCYAIQRRSLEEYENHRRFFEFVKKLPSRYRFWCVCDATQRLTLEVGGYGAFWWELYRDVVAQNSQYAETVAFEAHRVALYVNPVARVSESETVFAAQYFRDFLTAAAHSESIDIYKLVYSALCLQNFGFIDLDFDNLCERMLPWLRESEIPRSFAAGEWEAFNAYRGKRAEANVGLNTAIHSLIRVERLQKAKDLYHEAKQHGMKPNTHLERKLFE